MRILSLPCCFHWSLLLLACAEVPALAQTDIPPYGPAFIQDEIATIAITMEQGSVDEMLFGDTDYASTNPFPAMVEFQSSVEDSLFDFVAVRLRGNTSLIPPQKSFKV